MSELDRERVPDYFTNRETVSEWWTPDAGPLRFHYDAELAVLDAHCETQPDTAVLDVGTGRGRFGAHFAARGCRVTGVDLNPDMIEIARETARERGVSERFEILEGSAEDLSEFADGQFELVLCMELFDHLPDLGAALAAMRRTLHADGRFVFTYVPNESLYGTLGNVYRRFHARFRPGEVMISRTYGFDEVRERLADHGFELERYFGIGVLCANAQTRLFADNPIARAFNAVARAESRWRPYYDGGWLGRRGAHVVGIARATQGVA